MQIESTWSHAEIGAWATSNALVDRNYIRHGLYLGDARWEQLFSAVTVPTLLVVPEDSAMAPAETSVTNPLVRIERVPEAGHCVRRDRPDHYHAVVDPFLGTVRDAPSSRCWRYRTPASGHTGSHQSDSVATMNDEEVVVELRDVVGDAGAICRSILDSLPSWFGIPEAVDDYVHTADTLPSIIASVAGTDIGITTIKQHSEYAAEVYLMAVNPGYHRRGVGRAMLRHLERDLVARGVEFLQVKTLSASRPDVGYDKTRAFYLAYGFRPLEEFPTLWDPSIPALQLVKSVAPN